MCGLILFMDGKIEISQFEKPVNDNIAALMYCNAQNANAVALIL